MMQQCLGLLLAITGVVLGNSFQASHEEAPMELLHDNTHHTTNYHFDNDVEPSIHVKKEEITTHVNKEETTTHVNKEEITTVLKCPQSNGMFPVPTSCSKYLDCKFGMGTIHSCPCNLHFNAVTKHCTSPSMAACSLTCSQYNTFMPLPGRCDQYIHCIRGEPITKLCPQGLHFNPMKQICDKPENSQCNEQCSETETLFPVLGQCSSYIECHNNKAKVSSCPSNLHFNFLIRACDLPENVQCNLECEKPNGFFDIPGICSLYIKCINNISIIQKCPANHMFNPVVKQCDVAVNQSCSPHCPLENGIFPVLNKCDHFIWCMRGQAQIKQCTGELQFNSLIKACDKPERAKCYPMCPTPYGLFPMLGHCDIFFSCSNNEATMHHCPEGLHFNVRTLTCDRPAFALCDMLCPAEDELHPVLGDCSSYVECTHGKLLLKTCALGFHFNSRKKRCDLMEKGICVTMCPQMNGKFPMPGYCDSYLDCIDGQAHIHACPDGLLYNALLNACDLSTNVKCNF